MKKKKMKINFNHVLCIGITIVFLLCTVLVFPNSFVRLGESLNDLWGSVKYYFQTLFSIDNNVVDVPNDSAIPIVAEPPSVTEPSRVGYIPLFKFAETWTEFVSSWVTYWQVWTTKDNFWGYCRAVVGNLYNFSQIVLLVVIPLVLIAYLLFNHVFEQQNNDYNKDSKPLKLFKAWSKKTYIPVKNWCRQFIDFVLSNKIYKSIWLAIWLFNFNAVVIVIEFLAFYLYFAMSFDFAAIYPQVVKLIKDVTPMLRFVPVWVWVIIGFVLLDKLRKKVGYATLNHLERCNRGFINERPIVYMVCGTMGKKKTTAITDMALSQQIMLRDKAFEKILENDLKFPNFPWINLENTIKQAMLEHRVYNLATARVYMGHLAACFYVPKDKAIYKSVKRHLKLHYNINYDNLCFDYDFERYGLTYDDKLKVVDLWEVLETYAQLYFIYIIQSSLLIGNYSLRTDDLLSSLGNFPLWNSDLFHRDSRMIDAYSRHSHIIDFDALRLGRKVIENNDNKDSFDFGVVVITEVGKERKNNLQLMEIKKKDDGANQKNDGFNDWLKMGRHSATVDNFPFIKVITDEQRPESWGADARDLCEIVHIKETSETSLTMPFFFLGEIVYSMVYGWFLGKYNKYRFNRGDNTLTMYAIKKLATILQNHYTRIYNTFGYCKLFVQVESGTQDGKLADKKYYLMSKKIYSKRFSTDCFSEFFAEKSLRSKIGLVDLPEYRTEKATFEELQKQNSYFIQDLTNKAEKSIDKQKD